MISVVIPSYNGAETLFQAIDSVLCQTTKTPLEILVIDDNSTDDTLEKMGRYGENDRVRYIRNETNKGASASRNRGVQLAKGDYIAFLDADDYWDPEKLEKQEKALAKTGDVLCCTGRELIYDQEPEKQKIFSVPERPEIAKEYEESIPEFAYRLKVKAGLTGYAQIYGKYNTTAYDKLKLDLMYIESYSILEDLKLILATFKIVFTKESTEGLEEGQTISLNAKEEEKKDV